MRTWNQGRRWLRVRRPELYGPLTLPTGIEERTREVRFKHVDPGKHP